MPFPWIVGGVLLAGGALVGSVIKEMIEEENEREHRKYMREKEEDHHFYRQQEEFKRKKIQEEERAKRERAKSLSEAYLREKDTERRALVQKAIQATINGNSNLAFQIGKELEQTNPNRDFTKKLL